MFRVPDEPEIVSLTTLIKVFLWLLMLVVSAGMIFYPIRDLIMQYTFDLDSILTVNQIVYSVALVIGVIIASFSFYYLLKLDRRLVEKYNQWKNKRKKKRVERLQIELAELLGGAES